MSGNPKYKIQNPNGRAWGCHKKNGDYDNPNSKIQTPKSKIQDPKSKIQTPKSKIQNPKSKLQTPKSKIRTPNGPFGFLDFGVWIWGGRAGAGGDGYVANEDVWPRWPPEFGLVGGTQACNRKVPGSVPPTRGPN